jgi:hypothetical protein
MAFPESGYSSIPNVDIDIYARINQRSLDTAFDRVHRQVDQASRDMVFNPDISTGIERQAPRVQAAMVKVTDAARALRVEEEKLAEAFKSDDTELLVRQSTKVERAHRQHESALRTLHNAQMAAAGGASALAEAGTQAGVSLSKAAGPAGAAALVVGLGALTSVASAASGVLATIPGVAAAGGAAMGTLALGTQGFGDALDSIRDPQKFSESIATLSPNARQAAIDIHSLIPAFDDLKNATQDQLFAGIGPQIKQLSAELLPEVQQMTTTIAGAFNQMFTGAFSNPATLQALESAMQNIGTAFQALAPAAAPFTQAITTLIDTGSSFLPELASGLADAATQFNQLVTTAAQDGSLQEFIRTGIDVTGQLVHIVGVLTEGFIALGPTGSTVMGSITAAVDATSTAVRLLSGDMSALGDVIPTVGEVATSTFNALGSLIDGAVLTPLRAVIDLANKIPGMNLPNIPELQKFNPDGSVGSPPTLAGGGGIFGTPGRPVVPGSAGSFGGGSSTSGTGYGGIGTFTLVPPSGPSWGPPPNPFAYDPKKTGGSSGGSGDLTARTGDPMSLLGGVNVTSGLYSAASSVLDARHNLEEKRAELDKLEKSNTATSEQLQKARNDLAEAQQKSVQAEMALNEKKLDATNDFTKKMNSATGALNGIGAQLDSDFGASKGLPGIVENITKMIGNLAAAPYLGQLQAIVDADPHKGGFGAMGILGAQGAFGPDNTGLPTSYVPNGGISYGVPAGADVYSGPHTENTYGKLVPDAAAAKSLISQMFGVTDIGGYRNPDGYNEHSSGEALDIMIGQNKQLGDQINQFLLANADALGLQYTLFKQTQWNPNGTSSGMEDRGSQTANHQDHVHARFKPGAAAGGTSPIGMPDLSGSPLGLPVGVPMAPPVPAVGAGLPVPLPVIIVGGGMPAAPVIPGAPGVPTPGMPPSTPPGSPASGVGLGPLPGPQAWGAPGLPSIIGGGGEGPVLGGANPAGPGLGNSAGAPVGKAFGAGGWQPQGGGGADVSGGLLGAAATTMASAFPGGGQAAETAMKLITRSIGFGGQLASIGASGLLETFGLNDTELGDLSKSWLGRAAAGIAGVGAALPGSAGQTKVAQDQSTSTSNTYHGPVTNGGLTIEKFVQAPGRNGMQAAQELAAKSHAAWLRP